MQKFAKFHPLTPTFGGSIPGGWAGVFRHKTLEKRIKCSCDSVTCSKPSAKRENMGVWGHSPQEKFAVSNVCVVSFAERVVASLRQHGVRCGCLSRVPARRSSSVRRRRVRPPDENDRIVASGLLDAVRPTPRGRLSPNRSMGADAPDGTLRNLLRLRDPNFSVFLSRRV